MLALLALAGAGAEPLEPAWPDPAAVSDQTLVYYNARLALREGEPLGAVKLWFLRSAIESETGRVSKHDADFSSITWASLGELGICQDGQRTDEDGAGLWPIALHNWVIRNRSRRSRKVQAVPFRAFEVGRQARFVSIEDVLSADELRTLSLARGPCLRPRLALLEAGETLQAKLSDRRVATVLLRHLLEQARSTLDRDRVRGVSAIDARLFDIDLKLADLARRQARQDARAKALKARQSGLSRESTSTMREEEPAFAFDNAQDAKLVLRLSRDWSTAEWMALTPERRRFFYDQARTYVQDPEVFDAIALRILDASIALGEGAEAERWVARHGPDLGVDGRATIWDGERGRRLLALDAESGFGERAIIAVHQGVRSLEQGMLPEALRSFALAIQAAPASRVADEVQGLALRWMSYVASQFELTDDLLVTLQELLPRRQYSLILEDLLWSAAFRADRASFERGLRRQLGRGALERRVNLLEPLARGSAPGFVLQIETELVESPNEVLRFLDQLVQRLELEDSGVRAAQVPTLERLRRLLEPLADPEGEGRSRRRAESLMLRTLAILEGVGALGPDASRRDRARDLDPSGTVFAGSVRLAPSDPLPWPFRDVEAPPPSIYQPIDLVPVEWQDPDGNWVFGWSIEG